jgi:3',5'-cyclic AMP phosphodiesterase CpdA
MLNSQEAIDTFRKTLAFFKQESVDAVLIAGDLSNDGMMRELRALVGAWEDVFGAITRGPARIFVTGNHESVAFNQAKRQGKLSIPQYADALHRDVRANWQALFAEPWEPFFVKTVKGYSFVGAHWRRGTTRRRFAPFWRSTAAS